MWANLFQLLLTELAGSAKFHIGPVNIGITTEAGTPELVLSLNSVVKAPAPATSVTSGTL